MNSLIGGAEA